MSQIPKRYCIFGCDDFVTYGVPVHRFPNPDKYPDLFTAWVAIVGKKLEEIDPKTVYKNKRICDHHFDPIYKISRRRLKPKTIPTINLYGMQRTSTTFTDIDHCYSQPQRESFLPKPTIFNAGVLHVFPNPNKFPDRFRAWVSLVGGKLESSSDYDIYKKSRICDIHFTDEHRNRCKRLNAMAMPTLHLSGKPDIDQSASHESQPAAPISACRRFRSRDYDYVPAPVVTETPGTSHFYEVEIKNITAAAYVLAEHTYSVMSRAEMTTLNEGMCFRDTFQNDHSYDKKVTIVTPARGIPSKVIIKVDENTCNAQETHQDETVDATPSAKDADDTVKKEEFTEEPSAVDDDDDDFAPPSPVPEAEGSETIFSWQQSELIPADDVVEPLTADELEEKTGISLYCDDTPAPQTVPQVPETSVKQTEYRCKDCGEIIDGFQFWCVQCFGCALCGACEARGEHRHHYVLRAPPHRPYKQTQVVLATIRHQLQNENLLTQLGPDDDGVKIEVKEEPPEEDCSIVNTAPVEPDPLDAADPLRHEPAPDESNHTAAAKEIGERPFKRPRLADYIERNFTTQTKVTIPKPHKNIPINSDHIADQTEYVSEELKTARTKRHENIRINSDDLDDQVEYVMEELDTAKTKRHENIRIISGDVDHPVEYVIEALESAKTKPHESIHIDSDDLDDQVEYLEELDTDDDTRDDEYTEIEHLDDELINSGDSSVVLDDVIDFRMINETDVDNRIVGAESILSDLPRRYFRRNRKLPMRGSPESMVRNLSSEAVVELRPLNSVEIRKWTADSKIRRK